MTIRMLQAWNGLPQQTVTTLTSAEESRLVGLGLASFDLDGPADNLRTAQIVTDAAGGVGLLVGSKVISGSLPISPSVETKKLKIGVYYFPGWSTPGGGPNPAAPWSIIPSGRYPYMGQYDETLQDNIDIQLATMRDCGIDFVIIDWFFDNTTHSSASSTLVPFLEHWINGYLASTVPGKPKFCINWANSTNASYVTNAGFDAAVQYWISKYFSNPNYLTASGKPVVLFAAIDATMSNISGSKSNRIIAARAAAVAAGYPGLYWVNGISAPANTWINNMATVEGDAITTTNVFYKYQIGNDTAGPAWTDWAGLEDALIGAQGGGYNSWYSGFMGSTAIANAGKKIWLPCSAGWDSTPWNGSNTRFAVPTATQFATHLHNVRRLALQNYSRTDGFVCIQAWNEHGEGGVVEPGPFADGYGRVNAIRNILSNQ